MVHQGVDLGRLEPLLTRFRVFLLACQHLHLHRSRLKVIARVGVLDDARCLLLFNQALRDFLSGCTEPDPVHAALEFQEKLSGAFSLSERKHNPRAAALFTTIGRTIVKTIAAGTPEASLQKIHDDARDVARRFFAASPHQETQQRLVRACPIQVYYEPDETSQHALMSHTKHVGGDEIPINAGTIWIPFNATKTYASYLGYPFLFLHEYTAHVFAIDHGSGNDTFHDGWMLVAANAFFLKEKRDWLGGYPFTSEQLQAFNGLLAAIVQGRTKTVIDQTPLLYDWLTEHHPGWFERITFDLAAFRPTRDEVVTWPREILWRLFDHYERDPIWLGAQLQAVKTTQALMQRLPPVVFDDEP